MSMQEFGLYKKHRIFKTLKDKITWQDITQLQNLKNNFVFMPYNKTRLFYFLFYVYTFKPSQARKISVFPEKIS